jgi:hypothetical protein
MALKALTLGETFAYVSNSDPCKVKQQIEVVPGDPSKGFVEDYAIQDGATVFGLKPLDVFAMGYVYDNANQLTGRQGSDEVGIKTRINETNIEAVRLGLVYFKNFKLPNGSEAQVKFVEKQINGRDYKVASDETLQLLGIQLITELAGEIKKASEVSAREEKKSAGSLPQSA